MKYIFGPVNSRRLGRSLGIDFYLQKTCNLNCRYCEAGPSLHLFSKRKEYSPREDIIREIDSFCKNQSLMNRIDTVTITGTGEPTLHTGLGDILTYVKKSITQPVTVITNGTLLHQKKVQQELLVADVVMPSLDAVVPQSFIKLDRPAKNCNLSEIVTGITSFSHIFPGKIWLEVLLVKNINDSEEDIQQLMKALSKMSLDRIQLNTVFRPPAVVSATPVTSDFLDEVARKLAGELSISVDVPSPSSEIENPIQAEVEKGSISAEPESDVLNRILEMIKRRPCTASDINRTFNLGSPENIAQLLKPFTQRGIVRTYTHQNATFYQMEP